LGSLAADLWVGSGAAAMANCFELREVPESNWERFSASGTFRWNEQPVWNKNLRSGVCRFRDIRREPPGVKSQNKD